MKRTKQPRARFAGDPYVNGFTDVENWMTNIVIGSSNKPDELFQVVSNFEQDYIKILAKIIPKSEFERPQISARYRISDDEEDDRIMSFDIYGGEHIDMNGFVSELSVIFHELPCESSNLSGDNLQFLINNPNIYTKKFVTQRSSVEIDNFIDDLLEESDIIHSKTKAHLFAGSYYKGISFSEIQPYAFYMGTEYQANEYISIISGRDLINSRKVSCAEDVTIDSLSTLEDDIVDQKIVISFQDGTTYKSISAEKTTLTSDVFQMLLKKESSQNEE
jgi:hypothetical protein